MKRERVGEMSGERRGARRSAVFSLLIVLALLLPLGGYAPVRPAAPGLQSASAQSYPGWMTPEQAALFTNDWPALVPSYLPEPFASVVPSISIDGGTYRIYWLVAGGVPTFLDVRGYLNGYIPAGSAYDLNVELKVNATVRGYEAYHDPTPIYDAVYWREGGPSYWANSQGLSTDIVSYANSFTSVTVPAPEPTATVPVPATLYSPDAIASGGSGTVTASGGGTGATLTADGGYFPDTGTATYPGAGDAAVAWVAPDVTVDTTVTFSLLDADGTVLVTTPTLVTAAVAPVSFSLSCAATVGVEEALSISVTGSGNVMLDASAGSWPQTSPNTDYDPGTDGATLAFSLGAGGTATLTWVAPASARTATISAYGPSGMVVGSCQIEVVGEAPTIEPTAPVVTSTVQATIPGGVATISPSATAGAGQASATATATIPGTNPGDGTDPGSGTQPTVPGTGSGDGIDSGGGTSPAATMRPGDGTDFGGAATFPPGATYPAIPTSAPLPDAPPTSIPPSQGATTVPGQGTQVTVTAAPTTATAIPSRSAPTAASTAPPATVAATVVPATRSAPTATTVPPTATTISAPPVATTIPASATATSTAGPPTATTVPPTATAIPPTASATAVPVLPTATTSPTPTPTPTTRPASPVPTNTPSAALAAQATVPPTATVVLPTMTATSRPSTPTSTSIPPTSTATGVPATATSVPPTTTATPVPPTATTAPPTATTAPPTATTAPPTATATRRPPATATATPVRSGQGNRVAGSGPASPTATANPTVSPTSAPASPTVASPAATPTAPPVAETVTEEIGPDGGTVRHPAGAELRIGPGVFPSTMTVSMTQVPDTELPVSPDVDLVPSSGYDIAITGADGRAITTLPAGVVLRLTVPENVRDDAVVYWIDGGELSQIGVTNQEDAGISAPLAHLSRYVAGVPIDENPELGWLPWAVAIAAAISGLLIVGLLANHARRQRRRGLRAGRA